MLCGRIIEEADPPRPEDDDEDEPVKKPLAICPACQARLKREADDSQKVPKPM